MDRLIIERKLDSLWRCLERVRSKAPAKVSDLENDLDLQDVLVLNLSRAVQICVDIATHILSERRQPPPETIGKAFELLVACAGGRVGNGTGATAEEIGWLSQPRGT